MIAEVFLDILYELGEGPLWHDERDELFWCSILAGELNACCAAGGDHRIWRFGEAVSAAAIVNRDTLLIATASGLVRFDIDSGEREAVCQFPESAPLVSLMPDGAVADAEGCIWNAQWGAGRVARYDSKGRFIESATVPTAQVTCPACGGADIKTLFATSAWQGMDADARGAEPLAGAIFTVEVEVAERPEFRVDLSRS